MVVAELDGVTTLAAERGYDRTFEIVRDCLGRITDAAEQHGGSVDDGFGDWLLTTFGVTRRAPDAPGAALVAALAIRHEVEGYARHHPLPDDFGIRVGVDSGPVVAGEVGGPGAYEIAVMGEAVHGATVLKDLVPHDGIYVDPDTYLATRDTFTFRPPEGRSSGGECGWLPARELVGPVPPPAGCDGVCSSQARSFVTPGIAWQIAAAYYCTPRDPRHAIVVHTWTPRVDLALRPFARPPLSSTMLATGCIGESTSLRA